MGTVDILYAKENMFLTLYSFVQRKLKIYTFYFLTEQSNPIIHILFENVFAYNMMSMHYKSI